MSFGAGGLNFVHRLLRAGYLEFGRRRGSRELDRLPLVCVVHGPPSGNLAADWVDVVLGLPRISAKAIIFHCLFPGLSGLDSLPLARVYVLHSAVAKPFLDLTSGQGDSPTAKVFVVDAVVAQESDQEPSTLPLAHVVAGPSPGEEVLWLSQFSLQHS